jgi:hypothetical protein
MERRLPFAPRNRCSTVNPSHAEWKTIFDGVFYSIESVWNMNIGVRVMNVETKERVISRSKHQIERISTCGEMRTQYQ